MNTELLADEISSLEHRLALAEQSADASGLHHLLAVDFEGIDAHGRRIGRDAFISSFTSPELLLEEVSLSNVSIRALEDVAVVIGDSEARGASSGQPFHSRFHFTDVWIRTGTDWELATAHVSPTVFAQ